MFETDSLEVWNLTPGGSVVTGAQPIHNIVGRLKTPAGDVSRFTYSLNGGPEREIYFNPASQRSGRLQNCGDFNIDTIQTSELLPHNHLVLNLYLKPNDTFGEGSDAAGAAGDGALCEQAAIDFTCPAAALSAATAPPADPSSISAATLSPERSSDFTLNLAEIDPPTAESAGQVVDGRWRASRDEHGAPCLEIQPDDAGYDRIILFGRQDWTSDYEVSARLCVTYWTHKFHNVGLLFKWNPHLQGDGTHLPVQWSTGLAYYYSRSPGLRLRFGVDVRSDENGRKLGDTLLAEAPLAPLPLARRVRILNRLARWSAALLRKAILRPASNRSASMLPNGGRAANPEPQNGFSAANDAGGPVPPLRPGIHYRFHLRLHPEQYELTVWPVTPPVPGASVPGGAARPRPQLVVPRPADLLPHGSVGIIAYHCAVRLYEYEVRPL